MSKSRLWTLAMALAASMGRPASAQQLRQLESEIQELVTRQDISESATETGDSPPPPHAPRSGSADAS